MPAIVGTTVISVITACYRLDVTPSYPDMTWQTQYSTIGAITDPHTALLPYQNSGRLPIGVRVHPGLIELVTLLLREIISQHCFIAPIQ